MARHEPHEDAEVRVNPLVMVRRKRLHASMAVRGPTKSREDLPPLLKERSG